MWKSNKYMQQSLKECKLKLIKTIGSDTHTVKGQGEEKIHIP